MPTVLRADQAGHEDVRVLGLVGVANRGKSQKQVSAGTGFQLIVGKERLDESLDSRRVDLDTGQQLPFRRIIRLEFYTRGGEGQEKYGA